MIANNEIRSGEFRSCQSASDLNIFLLHGKPDAVREMPSRPVGTETEIAL